VLDKLKFLVSDVPSYMIFWVTQNCNARCAFCFNFEENLKKNHDLTVAEVERIADRFPHIKYLTLAGGEPTLREDLPEIARAFVERSGLQMCTIVTNGFKWRRTLEAADEICTRHPHLGLNIGVSIDFIGDRHDEHRKLKGCFAGCVKIIEGVREMRRRHPHLMVSAVGTYTKATADSMLETARTITETYRVPYHMNLVRGLVEDMALKEVDLAHYKKTVAAVLALQETVLPATTFDAPFRFALEELAIENIYASAKDARMRSYCQAGRKAVVLESNGKLRLCEMLPDDFGNVRDHDYDIPAMLSRPEARAIIDKVWATKCHCTWECFNRANVAFDPKLWPRLATTAARKAIRMRRNSAAA